MVTPTRVPGVVRLARVLFFANAAIWLAFAVAALVKLAGGSPGGPLSPYLIAGLMAGNAAAMLVAGLGIARQKRLFFYFAILVLALNIVLTVSDQFGVYDFITLLIAGFLLGLLLSTRSQYLPERAIRQPPDSSSSF